AVFVEVTKAVCDELAEGSFSQAFVPERSYADWEKPLEDHELGVNNLTVDVVGVMTNQAITEATRGSEPKIKYGVSVDVAVRKRFGTDKQDEHTGRVLIAEVDALALLVQEIFEFFHLNRIAGSPG